MYNHTIRSVKQSFGIGGNVMIYTVTFNPSLDYIVSVPGFELGKTNRTESEQLLPGGKGINVSILLNHIGIESTALGFCAGFTGEEIKRQLQVQGIHTDFIQMENGCARINLKLQNVEGTEINGMGPAISEEKTKELLERLDVLKEGDVLVLAGSIPASMPDDMYRNIAARMEGKKILLAVDATKDLLVNLSTKESVVPYAKKLQEKGARNVLISMAGEGAVLVSEDKSVFMAEAPKGTLINGVGAGDSMVAGFLAGWMKSHDYKEAFRMGVACGSASAFSEYLADSEMIEKVYNQVQVNECK